MSPLRVAWLKYQQAEFDKEWARDKLERELDCESAWKVFEALLIDTARKTNPAG